MSTVMNVVTDVVLAAQCGTAWRSLRTNGPEARAWSWFFGSMTCAAAAGAIRHAVHDGAPRTIVALLGVDVAVAVAVIAAQNATLRWRPQREHGWLKRGFDIQLGAFAASALWRLDFMPAFIHLSVGFGWVLASALAAARRKQRGAKETASGLAVACLAAIVYASRMAPADWFDHVDVAHTIVMGSLILLYRGARNASTTFARPIPGAGRVSSFGETGAGAVS